MGGMNINSSPEQMQEQLNIINNAAKQNAKKEADYQSRLQQYVTGGRGAGMGFKPRPEDADAAESARQKVFNPDQQPLPDSIEQPQIEGKKKGGKIRHYPSAEAAVKAADKRGDKSITVVFGHASKRADGIAKRGHTKGRYL